MPLQRRPGVGEALTKRELRDDEVDDGRRNHFEDRGERGIEILMEQVAIPLVPEVENDALEGRLRADASGTSALFVRLAPLVGVAMQVAPHQLVSVE